MRKLNEVPHRCKKAPLQRFPEFKNKCQDFRQMIIKWAALNPEIQDGDHIVRRTFLINLEKLNKNTFYPMIDDVVFIECHFIGGRENIGKGLVRSFNQMVSKNLWSVEI